MGTWAKLSPGIWEHSGQIYAMAQMVALKEACGIWGDGWRARDSYYVTHGVSEAEVERIAAEIVEKRRNGGET